VRGFGTLKIGKPSPVSKGFCPRMCPQLCPQFDLPDGRRRKTVQPINDDGSSMTFTKYACPFCGEAILEKVNGDFSIIFRCSSCTYRVDVPDLDDRFAICGECGGPTKFRHGAYGVFIGCMRFPKCRFKWTVPGVRNYPRPTSTITYRPKPYSRVKQSVEREDKNTEEKIEDDGF
jgi:ssDNA-binding Zn-finger/Zn-ribbon topoisomerase 1